MLRRILARIFWTLSPWKIVSQPAPRHSSILIGAPHTSNWDFILMIALAWTLGLNIHWLGKDSLFRGWRSTVMRKFGGIPVDREQAENTVSDIVQQINSSENFFLVITPDGTRGAHSHWKSGFYRIARQTGLPLTLGYVDRSTMTTGLGPTIHLTGNKASDMEEIRAFYQDKAGFSPDKRVEPRLKDES